jgi:hypothetical protein
MDELNPTHPSRLFVRSTKHKNISNEVSKYLETTFITYSCYDLTSKKFYYHKTPDKVKIKDICYN